MENCSSSTSFSDAFYPVESYNSEVIDLKSSLCPRDAKNDAIRINAVEALLPIHSAAHFCLFALLSVSSCNSTKLPIYITSCILFNVGFHQPPPSFSLSHIVSYSGRCVNSPFTLDRTRNFVGEILSLEYCVVHSTFCVTQRRIALKSMHFHWKFHHMFRCNNLLASCF